MSAVADVLVLVGLILFVVGGSVAAGWAFGVGIVRPPRALQPRLRELAWAPSALAAVGLVSSAAGSGLPVLGLWHSVGGAVIVAGLCLPVAPPSLVDTRPVPSRSGRHALRLVPRRTVRLRVVTLGCGYLAGVVTWFVALAQAPVV